MSKKLLTLSIITGAAMLAMQSYAATNLTTPTQKLSYTIGYEMGQNFKNQNMTIDSTVFMQGLQDALAGQSGVMTQQQRQQIIADFQKQMITKQEDQFKTAAAQNLKDGQAFLAANAKKEGVKTLNNGLQYKVITTGTGSKPKLTDTVSVNYAGQFIDGKVFDSSYQRGKPTTFQLNQVIKGWQQVLTMMPTGSTWEVYLPANLAYGERGMAPVIGPNETLVFKINLISIQKTS